MAAGDQYRVAREPDTDSPPPELVRAELARLLKSPEFSATAKRRDMLKFVIEESLAGRADCLKGYAIGLAVFGRDETFDPQADPIVRLEARRLRHDLDSYYISEGANNPLRIAVPKGQYAPRFHWQANRRDLSEIEGIEQGHGTAREATSPAAGKGEAPARSFGLDRRYRSPVIAGVLLLGLVIAAAAFYSTLNQTGAGGGNAASRGPSVMVLPFKALANDPEQAILATGIADQIMTALSRFSDFRIFLPRVSNGEAIAPETDAATNRYSVSYVIDGSVSSEGKLVRVSVKLIETANNQILWSDSYDRERGQTTLMDIERSIANDVATVIGQPYGVIKTEMANMLPAAAEPDATSYECVLRGYVYRRTFATQMHAPVLSCLEEAVRRDPDYAEAWAMLGWLYLDAGRLGRSPDGNKELAYDRALDAASHALTIDGRNVLALKAMSSINHYMGNFGEGERLAREALAINPNDPDSLAQLGWRLAARGNFKEGIAFLNKAIERTINSPGWYYHFIAVDHYLNKRYAEMLSAAKQGAIDGSGISFCLMAIASAELGNQAAATLALEKMAEVAPVLAKDPASVFRMHQANEEIVTALVNGMQKAGWQPPSN